MAAIAALRLCGKTVAAADASWRQGHASGCVSTAKLSGSSDWAAISKEKVSGLAVRAATKEQEGGNDKECE
jgi:hypothetical protein